MIKTGKEVSGFHEGDAVFGMVNFPGHGMAYAEYIAAPSSHLALKPENISHEEAAAASLAALTAWQTMAKISKITRGQKVLIHAAAGGVGHFAVQIAKYLGAHITGTCSESNKDFILNLGANEHVDYHNQRFENVVSEIDFVLDTIGGEYIDRSLDVMKKGGTIVSITSGMNEAVAAKASSRGINGTRFLVESNGEDMKRIAGLLKSGEMKSHICHVYRFDQMDEAHRLMETGHAVGKIIVIV